MEKLTKTNESCNNNKKCRLNKLLIRDITQFQCER